MKKLLIALLFTANLFAQEQAEPKKEMNPSNNHIDLETNAGKVFQGAFIGAFINVTVDQFTDKKNDWLKYPISILGAICYEVMLGKDTNLEKLGSVTGGAIMINVTFEIFNVKKRK